MGFTLGLGVSLSQALLLSQTAGQTLTIEDVEKLLALGTFWGILPSKSHALTAPSSRLAAKVYLRRNAWLNPALRGN